MMMRAVSHPMLQLALWLVAFLGLAASAHAELRVFTCEPEWAALAQALGGEQVEATPALTAYQDPHYIQARPSLIAKTRRADLVVCTGADLEVGWLPLLLRQSNNARIQPAAPGFFAATEHVELREKPVTVDRALGDLHPFGNPHVQTDPRNIATIAAALAERMATLDPGQADHYRARHAAFAERWTTALERWTQAIETVRGMKIVTHHRSWPYLIDWAGLVEVGNLEPKPGVPPSASHLAELLARIEGADVRLIVRSAYEDARASEWLSERTGIPATVLPQTVGAVDGADDLFSMFDVIVERLTDAAR